MRLRNVLLAVVAAALVASFPCSAQLGLPNPLKKKGKEQQDAKQREKDKKQSAKDERNYEKLKTFSLNQYENDLDFRDEVEKLYEEVLRAHSSKAFNMNLSPPSYTRVIREDRFRQHDGLYDNLVIQDYVNRLGQMLVPADSEKLFAFRLVASPIPYAETLATGTIYISTGLVAFLDNEAQLAYVLGHEMAHVYKEHYRLKAVLQLGEPEYNEKQVGKRLLTTAVGVLGGAALGAAIDRSKVGAGYGAIAGGIAGGVVGAILNPTMSLDWDKVQEDEADRVAFKAALDNNYDVNEVPKMYLALQNAGLKDSRVTLGFLGNRKRVKERTENANDLIRNSFRAELELKLKEGKLVGDNSEYRQLMAELKRDNGIMAYYHDMFQIAKANLAEAVAIRTNDSTAQYFHGKVLKLVARNAEERRQAEEAFVVAARHDTRHQNFGAHLHRALALMGEKNDAHKAQVVSELQDYVTNYLNFATNDARSRVLLPPHLDTIYDYMKLMGEDKWVPKLPDDTPMFLQADQPLPAPGLQTPALLGPAAAPTAPSASKPPAPSVRKVFGVPVPVPPRRP